MKRHALKLAQNDAMPTSPNDTENALDSARAGDEGAPPHALPLDHARKIPLPRAPAPKHRRELFRDYP